MKVNFHYHFYSRIFISLLIFAFGFFLLQKSVDTRALIPNVYQNDTPIVGWAWNGSMGWIALSCANDFDGDGIPDGDYINGTGSCSTLGPGVKWGLKMSAVSGTNYIQGCAWAGNTADSAPAEAAPGWICFSDTVPSTNDAPTNGVRMSNAATTVTSCQCEMDLGVCEGTITPGTACSSHSVCSGGTFAWQEHNKCVSNHCTYISSRSCSIDLPCPDSSYQCISGKCTLIATDTCQVDDDCAYACAAPTAPDPTDPGSSFLLYGVCFDYSAGQQAILDTYRGSRPPFSDIFSANPSMHTCYINKDCYGSTPGSAECVYPQFGISAGRGNGVCKNSSGVLLVPELSCAYDFDCRSASLGWTNYCEVSFLTDLPAPPDSCDIAMCNGAYSPQESSSETSVYINALNPETFNSPNSYASILKMEPLAIGDNEGANQIGFPIDYHISNDAWSPVDIAYDPDNPNIGTAGSNPLRGCFNCYSEKIYKCSSGISCNCTDQNDNTCVDELDRCESGPDSPNSCIVDELVPTCENCMEYFYYSAEKNYQCLSGRNCSCSPDASGAYPDTCIDATSCENDTTDLCVIENKTCSLQPNRTCNVDDDCESYGSCIYHQVGDLKKVLTGFNCTDCTIENPTNSCSLNASNLNNNRCNRCQTRNATIGYDSTVYRLGGLIYDNKHGQSTTSTLCGWGFNDWSNKTGFGWFNFSPLISTSTKPYFSVEKGNIYSKGRIATRYQPPISKYNASYLIESGGNITNFVSKVSKEEEYQGELENRPIINFLTPNSLNTQFKNALGKLDYNGLLAVAKTVGTTEYNKYGSVINDVGTPVNINSIFDNPLNNQVFYVAGPHSGYAYVYVDALSIVEAGDTSLYPSGAGIIIVNGDLKIRSNVQYDTASGITNLKQIPSLVWIVKGDVTIEAGASEVAGTFIVLGKGTPHPPDGRTDCSDLNPYYTGIPRSYDGCGQFKSLYISTTNGNPANPDSNFLKVYGNVLARKFVLERTKVDADAGTPAEQFINDGRLQSNPPLGLTDLSKVIPRFSSY